MDYCEIGRQIRRARKARGLSQEELAERINISTTHMSHIETGKTKLSLQVFVDIVSALKVGADELLKGQIGGQDQLERKQIDAVLNRCSTAEAKIIVATITALKLSMDENL